MSLVINAVLAGGNAISATGAVLRVLAPTGSTVSISRSGAYKTATGISLVSESGVSCYYFSLKSSEFSSSAWTVTATSGAESDSDTIVINAAGEYGVVLSFWDGELYDSGNEYASVTGGFEAFAPAWGTTATGCAKNDSNLTVASPSVPTENWYNGAFGTVNSLDLSGYTTLHVTTTAASSVGSNSHFAMFGVTDANDSGASADTPHGDLSVGENTLDISSVNSGHIWFGASSRVNSGTSAGSYNVAVTKIWMT